LHQALVIALHPICVIDVIKQTRGQFLFFACKFSQREKNRLTNLVAVLFLFI